MDYALETIRPMIEKINNDYIQEYLSDQGTTHAKYFKYIRSDDMFLKNLTQYRIRKAMEG